MSYFEKIAPPEPYYTNVSDCPDVIEIRFEVALPAITSIKEAVIVESVKTQAMEQFREAVAQRPYVIKALNPLYHQGNSHENPVRS